MQDGVRCPPRLVIIKIVLRETAYVEDAEMRIDARPAVRRRLTAIIKTGPDKAAGEPRAFGEITPPALRRVRPARRVHVVGADVAARLVVFVNAPRADGAARSEEHTSELQSPMY